MMGRHSCAQKLTSHGRNQNTNCAPSLHAVTVLLRILLHSSSSQHVDTHIKVHSAS